jgi:hypothetical protein
MAQDKLMNTKIDSNGNLSLNKKNALSGSVHDQRRSCGC